MGSFSQKARLVRIPSATNSVETLGHSAPSSHRSHQNRPNHISVHFKFWVNRTQSLIPTLNPLLYGKAHRPPLSIVHPLNRFLEHRHFDGPPLRPKRIAILNQSMEPNSAIAPDSIWKTGRPNQISSIGSTTISNQVVHRIHERILSS